MTLSSQEVIDLLGRNFVSAYTSIKGKTPYAGVSNTHMPENPAIEVSNCAGHHNVQMFFLTSDGRVLHCLPGYWNKRDFLEEAKLALDIGKLYYRSDLTAAKRNAEYLELHLRHALAHGQALREASYLQGFDKQSLEKRKESDFHRTEGFVSGLKTPDQVVHERLAERPFLPFQSFDVASYIDMGIKQYKYDYGLPGKGMSSSKPGEPPDRARPAHGKGKETSSAEKKDGRSDAGSKW